jgi:hypothetical protein
LDEDTASHPSTAGGGGDATLLDTYSVVVSDVAERVGASVVKIDVRKGDLPAPARGSSYRRMGWF